MVTAKTVPGDRVQIQIRITTEIKRRLEAQAERRMVSVNYLAGRALSAYLEGLEEVDDD